MAQFILKRILVLVPVLLGVSVIVFALLYLTPGDPALLMLGEHAPPEQYRALREKLGLDDPVHIQYLRWLWRAVQLDLGDSIRSSRPVVEEIVERIPGTVELAVLSVLLATFIGIPAGVISATRPNSWLDNIFTVLALGGVSMPVFWQALMLIIIFSVNLGWLPPSGRLGGWEYFVLPVVTLGTSAAASITRMTRATMLEAIHEDYVRTARAKGLDERRVIYRHALRNALLPVVTVIGLEFGNLMAGAVITETIFAWPGIGRLAVDAIRTRDYPVVQGVVMTFALSYVLINLIVDLLYAYLDPRLRVRYH
ncbi:MAG: ABC transporter permease [Limnochordales bacterium]|nr:MAG: peptide ABC transporter [Bacillota bacterium]HLT58546.1 nickel ABC transporter permease [Limnochordales bacterium]